MHIDSTNQYFLYSPDTISLWNNLPYNVVSTVPFSTFKCCIHIYTVFFQQAL